MRADIHDDPEHNRSKQRSDTLMQDRICRIDENLLHRAAGPYIGSKPEVAASVGYVRSTPESGLRCRDGRRPLRAHKRKSTLLAPGQIGLRLYGLAGARVP